MTKFQFIGGSQRYLNPEEVSKFTVGCRSIGEQDIAIHTDRLLISLDITQDVEAVYNSYLDTMGHSENFYTNVIYRLNREYGADIDLTKFKLIGAFQRTLNPEEVSKFTVGWRSIGEQDIEIPGLNLTLHFSDGEFLNLYEKDGISCKYTMDQIRSLVHRGNHVLCEHWIDTDRHAAFCCIAKTKKHSFSAEFPNVDSSTFKIGRLHFSSKNSFRII